ncbi:MAG: proline dehydrogenase family protein [Acidobacteria bacterium]|nr:proline dehydrogenase family protein [Acidobacteriota bacterium]MCI0717636.1 proline dehydrogenase family protein [Acidobacteriota bacterium]
MSPLLNQLLFPFARRFVAGRTIDEAVAAVCRLNATGISTTLDVLGENVSDCRAAGAAVACYLEALDRIQKEGLHSNVSLKLTQMGLDIDRDYCFANLSRICERAAAGNNYVRIDMEGSAYTEKTLNFYYNLFGKHQNVGIVIQAYLHRSGQDVRRLIELGARVRLCKGAYNEPSSLALQAMPAIRQNFMNLAALLLQKGNYPAIATHDDVLISWTKEYTAQQQIAQERFEFQMLYGVRAATQRQLAAQGYRMRVYVPFGTHWLPYFYRRLRERKENVAFVLRNLFRK